MQSNNHPTITVSCASLSEACRRRALKLSESLQLLYCDYPATDQGMCLVYTESRLELRHNLREAKTSPGPLFVDFLAGNAAYRLRHDCTIHQPLARAAGIKPGFRPSIVDATAGLGQDGFVLASLGCPVTLIERDPILGALLEDGLQRALHDRIAGGIIRDRMRLIVADARAILATLAPRPDTIYLDPMYPVQAKSALNKKEMRIIRSLVGDDQDSAQLLAAALQTAGNRVVVKRPKEAPEIAGPPPSHTIRMKNGRFDVYLTSMAGPD